jgi:hypothetical protein
LLSKPWIRFSGMPQSPNPPTNRVDPSWLKKDLDI